MQRLGKFKNDVVFGPTIYKPVHNTHTPEVSKFLFCHLALNKLPVLNIVRVMFKSTTYIMRSVLSVSSSDFF